LARLQSRYLNLIDLAGEDLDPDAFLQGAVFGWDVRCPYEADEAGFVIDGLSEAGLEGADVFAQPEIARKSDGKATGVERRARGIRLSARRQADQCRCIDLAPAHLIRTQPQAFWAGGDAD